MTCYSLSMPFSSSALVYAGAGFALADLEPGATDAPNITEICVQPINVQSALAIGLGRASNTPVQQARLPLQPEDDPSGVPSLSSLGTTWTVAPTAPAQMFRRLWGLTAASFIIWTFPLGLRVPLSTSMVLWNGTQSAGGISSVWSIEE
jgi:hypothetical protein